MASSCGSSWRGSGFPWVSSLRVVRLGFCRASSISELRVAGGWGREVTLEMWSGIRLWLDDNTEPGAFESVEASLVGDKDLARSEQSQSTQFLAFVAP